VSRYGTTGRGDRSPTVDLSPLVTAAHEATPGLPVLVGFGVRDPMSARRALATGADGVVIGTALEERCAAGARPEELRRWLAPIVRSALPAPARMFPGRRN